METSTKDKVLVFIPMYNCEKQIVRVLEQLTGEVSQFISEAILVNNRSTDGTETAAIEKIKTMEFPFTIKVLRNEENYGLGGSHKVAFNYAIENNFDYVIVLHGDDQGHIDNLLPHLKAKTYQDYDCFLGARFKKGSRLDGYSAFRTFGNRVYNFLFSLVLHHRIYDLGSGLNMYSTNILRTKFFLRFKDNLMFNYCMILSAAFYKHRIEFFPIRWSESDQVSNVKMMSQAITVLKLLFSYAISPKKFILAEHRDNATFTYKSEEIFVK